MLILYFQNIYICSYKQSKYMSEKKRKHRIPNIYLTRPDRACT